MAIIAKRYDYMLLQYHDLSWQVLDVTTGSILFTSWSKKDAQEFIEKLNDIQKQ